MYIKEFEVENLKCFKNLRLDFRGEDGEIRRWTTLLGENGLGKTTLLRAMAVPLAGPEAVLDLDAGVSEWIRHGEDKIKISGLGILYKWKIRDGRKIYTTIERPSNLLYNFFIVRNLLSEESIKELSDYEFYDKTKDKLSYVHPVAGRMKIDSGGIAFSTFDVIRYGKVFGATGYGPFRRFAGCSDYAFKIISNRESQTSRFATLFREDAAFSYVEQWLKDLHNLSREGDAASGRSLERVRALLREGFFPEPMELYTSAAEVRFSYGGSGRLPLEALSDGYRAMMVLGLDLLRGVMESWPESEEPTKMPGVVLIDELDAHLHPRWQRELGLWLQDRFPGLQFIVATHSPFLAQAAPPGGNIVLKRDASGEVIAEQHPGSVSTWRAEQILNELFGLSTTRSPLAERKVARFQALQRQARAPEEEREFQALQAELSHSPSLLERPEDRAMMQRLQQLLAQRAPKP